MNPFSGSTSSTCMGGPDEPLSSSSFPMPYFSPWTSNSPVVGGLKWNIKPAEGSECHHRCSSDSVFMEGQPSWLNDLLNDPEDTQVVHHRGHRRSASDTFAYVGATTKAFETWDQEHQKHPHPNAQKHLITSNINNTSSSSSSIRAQNVFNFKSSNEGAKLDIIKPSSSSSTFEDKFIKKQDSNATVPGSADRHETEESCSQTSEGSTEGSSPSQTKPSVSKPETKRTKQQSAQRSRVRKLQYIAHLERTVQVLQATGSKMSAELEFLDHQNLILNMENRALKQRLDSLSQEQLIKQFDHEMLERELGRLQALCRLQVQEQMRVQQQQNQKSQNRRTKSKDAAAFPTM